MNTNFNCATMLAKKAYQTPSTESAHVQLNRVVMESPLDFGGDISGASGD